MQHFECEEQIQAIGNYLAQVQVSPSYLRGTIVAYIVRWKDTLRVPGLPIAETDNISASLNDAVKMDTDYLRWCVRRTVDQHRQLLETVRPILNLASTASEAARQKAQALLEMEEVVQLREVLMVEEETFSVSSTWNSGNPITILTP